MVDNIGQLIDLAMTVAQDHVAEGTDEKEVKATFFLINGYSYSTVTGEQIPNIALSGDVVGSISNDFDRDRDIQGTDKRVTRFNVSREKLMKIGLKPNMFNIPEMRTESYFEILGVKYNVTNISGVTGNLYTSFYLEQR